MRDPIVSQLARRIYEEMLVAEEKYASIPDFACVFAGRLAQRVHAHDANLQLVSVTMIPSGEVDFVVNKRMPVSPKDRRAPR